MYDFITHTWNVIKGKCPHDCEYCYMKAFPQPELHFDEKELKTDLGSGNKIFVGSSCDMWADKISDRWLLPIMQKYIDNPDNTYLFQSKNPGRFLKTQFIKNTILATTIETNRHYPCMGNAPSTEKRHEALAKLQGLGQTVMVTIEPILDFDLHDLLIMLRWIHPAWVNIGADSKHHNLPEPPAKKILELIEGLKEFTEVRQKNNLSRLLAV